MRHRRTTHTPHTHPTHTHTTHTHTPHTLPHTHTHTHTPPTHTHTHTHTHPHTPRRAPHTAHAAAPAPHALPATCAPRLRVLLPRHFPTRTSPVTSRGKRHRLRARYCYRLLAVHAPTSSPALPACLALPPATATLTFPPRCLCNAIF